MKCPRLLRKGFFLLFKERDRAILDGAEHSECSIVSATYVGPLINCHLSSRIFIVRTPSIQEE